jgi:hypothetical protein
MEATMREDEKKGFKYCLTIKGVFGRNRKAKFEVFSLVARTEEQKPLDAVMPLANAMLAHIKAKPGAVYKVTETPITWGESGNGISFESFMMFSGVTLAQGVVS